MKRLRKYTNTLWVWRNLELSQNGQNSFNLAYSASERPLPCGRQSKEFRSLWEAGEYLREHGFTIEN